MFALLRVVLMGKYLPDPLEGVKLKALKRGLKLKFLIVMLKTMKFRKLSFDILLLNRQNILLT